MAGDNKVKGNQNRKAEKREREQEKKNNGKII